MRNDVPVLILCGGYGSRLGPESDAIPKPMIPIGGRPILWHIMKIYSVWGFNNFILALGYKAEHIKDYFLHYNEHLDDFNVQIKTGKRQCIGSCVQEDWTVKLIDTGLDTLKGGRIKRVERFVDTDNFLLTYGDGVADINLQKLEGFHSKHGLLGTVTGVNPPSRFGELIVRGDRIRSFSEKPQVSQGLINGGFFVFKKDIFDHLTQDANCDFEKGPLEKLAKENRLRVYRHPGSWECMDTIRDVNHLNKLWNEKKAFWKLWKD